MGYFNGSVKRYKRGRGRKRASKRRTKEVVMKDISNFICYISNFNHSIFKTLKAYSIKDLDLLYSLSETNCGIVYNLCSSFCTTFSHKHKQKALPAEECENIILSFTCKFIDNLKFKSITSDTSITKLLPPALQKHLPLRIFYRYQKPISLYICNYSKFLKNLTLSDIKNIVDSPCNCQNSPFFYEPLGHILTGDLSIVRDRELREILSYGCKYRLPENCTAADIRAGILEDLNNFVKSKQVKYHTKITAFSAWKDRVMQIIDNKIEFYQNKHPNMFLENVNTLEKGNIKNELKRLRNKYIICSIDKASKNFSFVCKKLYVLTLLKELGFNLSNLSCSGNETYFPCESTEIVYVEQIRSTLSNQFNLDVDENNQCLAHIFWNPKLHKNPYKARFIAGAKKCATKPLNILVNSSLKLLRKYFKKYCQTISNNCGINFFWSIDSSNEFLETLRTTDVHNLQIYDFTTLYTKLDLCEVDIMISEVIDLIFSSRNKYICICKYNYDQCFFSKKEYNNHYIFTKEKLKEAVSFIIHNTYIVFGGQVFIQKRGIPMGGNSSSPIADLTLAKREFNYMKQLLKNKKYGLAKLLSNNKRYVDDLIIFNYLYFHNLIRTIYPSSLDMERAGNNNKNVNYLDLNVSIEVTGISLSVYNKTDDFNFEVVTLTFPHSNIPIEIGYNVFYSQVLRYANICTNLEVFISHLSKTFNILISRGYLKSKLLKSVRRCMRKYSNIFVKFGVMDDNMILLRIG